MTCTIAVSSAANTPRPTTAKDSTNRWPRVTKLLCPRWFVPNCCVPVGLSRVPVGLSHQGKSCVSSSLTTQWTRDDCRANIFRSASCRFSLSLDELDGYSKRWPSIIPDRTSRTHFRKYRVFQKRRANFGEANEPGHGRISRAVPQSRSESGERSGVSPMALDLMYQPVRVSVRFTQNCVENRVLTHRG